jgi:hypothetical protein
VYRSYKPFLVPELGIGFSEPVGDLEYAVIDKYSVGFASKSLALKYPSCEAKWSPLGSIVRIDKERIGMSGGIDPATADYLTTELDHKDMGDYYLVYHRPQSACIDSGGEPILFQDLRKKIPEVMFPSAFDRAVAPEDPLVSLVLPNPGDNHAVGEWLYINWVDTESAHNVPVSLYLIDSRKKRQLMLIAENVTVEPSDVNGTLSYTWMIPKSVEPGIEKFKVEVRNLRTGASDRTDGYFTIAESSAPRIDRISPARGPVGTEISLYGRFFSGYHGDEYAWIEDAAGNKGIIYSDRQIATDSFIPFTLEDKYCTVDVSYSGKECQSYLDIVPGTYEIFVHPWSRESNRVTFTVVK